MNKREYQYLVAGLPAISPGEKLWTTLPAFRDHLEEHLHPEDFDQVRLILLQKDHQNLLRYIETGEFIDGNGGNVSSAVLEEPLELPEGMDPGKTAIPAYIMEILAALKDEKTPPSKPAIQRRLDEGFLEYIMEHGNEFLKKYYTFHYDLENLLTFQKAGAHKMDQQEQITGSTQHASHLREHAGRNLAKDPEFEYFDEILSISGNPSFAEQEKNIDLLKWRVIDEMNLYEYFTIEKVLGYLLQMIIAERWSMLDKARGETKLRGIIDHSLQQIKERQMINNENTI
jgi:hypothetical protein